MSAISVVIPVYNGEKYLAKCLDSLLSQEFSDYELIIVNDGSSDNSRKICEDYLPKFNSAVLIDVPNSGVSHARNVGIEKASGEYVFFMDADDILSSNCLAFLYEKACITSAELVCATFQEFDSETGHLIESKVQSCDAIMNSETALNTYGKYRAPCEYIYPKLFLKKTIDENNIRFDSLAYFGEDTLFSMCFIKASSTIFSCNEIIYFHRKYEGSSAKVSSMTIDGIENIINVYEKIISLSENGLQSQFAMIAMSYITIDYMQCFIIAYIFDKRDKVTIRRYRHLMNRCLRKCNTDLLSFGIKVKSIFINLCPWLLKLYYKFAL